MMESTSSTTRLAVLLSGSGTNLQAILDACAIGKLPAKVVVVVANKAGVFGLERASHGGIPAVVKVKKREQDRL